MKQNFKEMSNRLAAYYFWDDTRSLEQAVLVALKNEIHFDNVKHWSEKEGELEKYNIFLAEYRSRNSAILSNF